MSFQGGKEVTKGGQQQAEFWMKGEHCHFSQSTICLVWMS